MAVGVGICAERLQHVGGQLPPDDKLDARLAGQLDVFDAGKAGAVALDHIRQVVIAVHTGKDAGSERPVPCRLQKRDRFFLSVAVEIGQLHRLLIRAGHRRRIGSALAAQNRIDCNLQPVIFIRMPRQRIQLVDRFDKTA